MKTEKECCLRHNILLKLQYTQWNCNNTDVLQCLYWQRGKWGKTAKIAGGTELVRIMRKNMSEVIAKLKYGAIQWQTKLNLSKSHQQTDVLQIAAFAASRDKTNKKKLCSYFGQAVAASSEELQRNNIQWHALGYPWTSSNPHFLLPFAVLWRPGAPFLLHVNVLIPYM